MPPLTDEQKKAIESISDHVLVSAGAGSGKTFVLVERYLQVLKADPAAAISNIIAVTFTRKAAEEMRCRLKSRLKELVDRSDNSERQRWLQCLSEVESARIGTIHSLCESILKNYPSEAGVDPGFRIMDDLERAELLAESIGEAMLFAIDAQIEHRSGLLDYPVEGLRGWLSMFLQSPLKYKEARAKLGDCSPDSMKEFAANLIAADIRRALDDLLANKSFKSEYVYLQDNAWFEPASRLGLLQSEMLSYLHVLFDKSHAQEERFKALQSLGNSESARTVGGSAAKELRRCMRELRTAAHTVATRHKTALNEADSQAFPLLRALIMLADDALLRYEKLKQQNQKLDFDDLIQCCCKLVVDGNDGSENPSELRLPDRVLNRDAHLTAASALRLIGRDLQAVLVDEFQDTNWTQARLLTALAGMKAKLFLIGDDKQSIYKFQGADVGTFNACKSFIAALSAQEGIGSLKPRHDLPSLTGKGQLMTLSRSFRSHSQIVKFVNNLFRSLFITEPDAEQFKSRFQALCPARVPDEFDGTPRIDITYAPPFDKESGEAKPDYQQMEAQLTAAWILKKVESAHPVFDKQINGLRPLTYSDFAVLLQANSDFAAFERAFAQAGIPYVSVAGSGFLDRQEILDLENMLKWLSCPQDSHALFAVLRSPFFGFADDLLHDLKAGKKASLWQCLSESASAGQDDLQHARESLYRWQMETGRLATPDLLRKLILESGYDIVLLSTPSGRQKSRNVFKFLTLACQYRHMSISEFLKALATMRELGVKNMTDAPLSADNAVKIMTIHKSKGLEFPAVALPRLGRSVYQRPDKLIFGKDMAIALDCTRDSDEEKPAFFVAANNLSRKMDEEEKKRLLYVALTRARDYLGLFITPHSKRVSNFSTWLIQALGLPESDEAIEKSVMSAGRDDERCFWTIQQPEQVELPARPIFASGSEEPGTSPEVLLSEGQLQASARRSEPLMAEAIDFSLLDDDAGRVAPSFAPVPWEALLRVCPAEQSAAVHATIAGNYFHLLMSKLGPKLELPPEKVRRALLLSHEVAVHDPVQQEWLLQEAERLLTGFGNSSLYRLLKTARRRISESTYLIVRAGEEEELRPDLIVEDAEGNWHVVDYKTDQIDLKQVQKQTSSHQAQLERYVDDLRSLLGIEAKPWVYFAQLGRLEPVDLSKPVQLSLL